MHPLSAAASPAELAINVEKVLFQVDSITSRVRLGKLLGCDNSSVRFAGQYR